MTSKSNLSSDNSYYNFWIKNDGQLTGIEASLNEERIGPVLDRMQDYSVSVARFSVPGSTIPLFKFEFLDPPANTRSAYTITVASGNDIDPAVAEFDLFIDDDLTFDPTTFNTNDPYKHFVYYYQQFINMFNRSMSAIWAGLRVDPNFTAIYPILATMTDDDYPRLQQIPNTPYLEIKFPLSATAPFIGQSPFLGFNPGAESLYLFLNPKLFYFLAGFNSNYFKGGALNSTTQLQVPDAVHLLNPINFSYQDPALLPLTVATFKQDYSSLHNWQQLSRIVFTTAMPIESESVGVNDGDGTNYNQTMLTDFEIQPNANGSARETIYYYPQGENRPYNFTGTGPLRKMSIRVFFQLRDLSLIPLIIAPGFDMTLKLQFKRRQAANLLQYGNTNSLMYP
jgi:hypothetical protein